MEVDPHLEVRGALEATCTPLDGHDLAVKALGNSDGDWMAKVARAARSSGFADAPARHRLTKTIGFGDQLRCVAAGRSVDAC